MPNSLQVPYAAVVLFLTGVTVSALCGPLTGAPTQLGRPDVVTVDQVVERAGEALAAYAEELSLVIGVEQYAQYIGNSAFQMADKRILVSEFALVRSKDDWLGFRDVYAVDGKPVGDRQDRLRQLFMENPGSALSQARRISDESARYNLGVIRRNFNVPTVALFFLAPPNAKRFRFRKDGEERLDGTSVWRVDYDESQRPTIIRTSMGKDMPVKGSFWIDPATGRVLKTHMELRGEVTTGSGTGTSAVNHVQSSASITVTYRNDASLGLLLPDEMLETYEAPTANRLTGTEYIMRINCRATYSGFKKFQTSGRVLSPK